ncbi:haloacid dehalogenase-like hydrolase [Xylaria sp. CBS 124048]|nr:haloacid dehalogenase-like hydrolase [Xylaria sp. CBS 124048]
MAKPSTPRRFAPLRDSAGRSHETLPSLKGVIFDVDGTLCLPQNYMFAEMRSVLGISKTTDILTHISSLPTAAEQATAMAAIRAIERKAMESQEAQPGLSQLMQYLQDRGMRKAICTRNFDLPVTHLLEKFLSGHHFAPIVTRDFRPPKPDPAGLLFIARSWGLVRRGGATATNLLLADPGRIRPDETELASGVVREEVDVEVGDASSLIMVGDSIDDMTAGRHAGAATVLLMNSQNAHLAEHPHTDLVIKRLDELVEVLENGFVGREILR